MHPCPGNALPARLIIAPPRPCPTPPAGAIGLVAAPAIGASQEGFKGFAKGAAAGVAGAVLLPVTGVVVGAVQVRGCRQGVGYWRAGRGLLRAGAACCAASAPACTPPHPNPARRC